MSKHTTGKWNWHTSNSWRRLYSDQGHGKQVPVIVPFINPNDGHEDLSVSDADMRLTEAAPDLLVICKAIVSLRDDENFDLDRLLCIAEWAEETIEKAEGRR